MVLLEYQKMTFSRLGIPNDADWIQIDDSSLADNSKAF